MKASFSSTEYVGCCFIYLYHLRCRIEICQRKWDESKTENRTFPSCTSSWRKQEYFVLLLSSFDGKDFGRLILVKTLGVFTWCSERLPLWQNESYIWVFLSRWIFLGDDDWTGCLYSWLISLMSTWRIIPGLVSGDRITPIYKPCSSAIWKGSHNPILRQLTDWDDPPSWSKSLWHASASLLSLHISG